MSNNKKQTPTPPLSLGEGSGVRPHKPWLWIPTLYFAEGLPYVAVMTLAVILYKRLGLSNTEIALYTSWLYLPWTIKPLWSPFVDLIKTKRWWITTMQALIAASMAGIAFLALMVGVPAILNNLGKYVHPMFHSLYHLTLDYMGSLVVSAERMDWALMGRCWIIGLAWAVLSTAVGLFFFSRREIN